MAQEDKRFLIEVPIMTQELFATKIGVTKDSVRGMIPRLPTMKIGKRRFINVAALTDTCLQEADLIRNKPE